MNLAELKLGVKALAPSERRQLAAFLVSLRLREIEGHRERLAEKIDDRCPDNWVSYEGFRESIASSEAD